MTVEIGRLNHRVTVQSRTTTTDAYGQQLDTWSDLATVWANIKPIGGRERLRAMAMESTLTHTVMVRYRAAFTPPILMGARRIAYQGRIFNIVAARDVDEGRTHIIFDCTEGSLDGQ